MTPSAIQTIDRSALGQEILQKMEEGFRHAEFSVRCLWKAGQLLRKAKADVPPGEWLAWLKSQSIPVRRAQRCMALAKCEAGDALEEKWSWICGRRDSELPPEDTDQKGPSPSLAGEPLATVRVLCEACQKGPVKIGCNGCKEARKKELARRRQSRQQTETAVMDALGQAVPKWLLDVYCDPFLGDMLDQLAHISTEFRETRLADGVMARQQHFPFIQGQEVVEGVGFVCQYLDQIIDHLKQNRPAAVCPNCHGARCGECGHSGLIPRKNVKENQA